MEDKKTLTVKKAIEQGYTTYVFASDGFQGLKYLSDLTDEDLDKKDIELVEKEPYTPDGISSVDIAELLAEHLQENHSSECGDDTDAVYDAIKEIDFTCAEDKIIEALSKLYYYKSSGIKLIR